jgi:hypothetical protein
MYTVHTVDIIRKYQNWTTKALNDEIMKRDDALNASLLHFFNFSPKLTLNSFIAPEVASIGFDALKKKNIKASK